MGSVQPDPSCAPLFASLRARTPARIGLGRTGDSLPLSEQLDLQQAHARARDAVHGQVNFAALAAALDPRPSIQVRSQAADRATFLRRPDLGRLLAEADLLRLDGVRGSYDLAIIIADGLSASAVNTYAAATAKAILTEAEGYQIGPIVFAHEARVALADEIGERLGAKATAMLIGERPGLTISDSLGIYVTASPRPGRADSERNCISNINAHGLTPEAAGRLCGVILSMARQLGRTGTELKPPAL